MTSEALLKIADEGILELQADLQRKKGNANTRLKEVTLSDHKNLLWEENRDCDDLVNLANPPKQMNHNAKHHTNSRVNSKAQRHTSLNNS